MKTSAAILQGVEVKVVEIEAFIGSGFSGLTIIGLPNDIAKDMRERVRSALESSGIAIPAKRMIVNISCEASIKLTTTPLDQLDFAVAACIATTIFENNSKNIGYNSLEKHFILGGTLSLTGSLKPVNNPLLYSCLEILYPKAIISLPEGNRDGMRNEKNLHFFNDFSSWINFYKNGAVDCKNSHFVANSNVLESENEEDYVRTLSLFKDNLLLLLTVSLASAGRLNCLLTGEPGVGKSFTFKNFQKLLPPLTEKEEITHQLIYQNMKIWKNGTFRSRPFLSPHHSSSSAALIGGASLRPGEITLAHNGVLFLDELAEFSRHTLEALREPMDSSLVQICKAAGSVTFPADFQLCATTNPCPCGFLLSTRTACRCQPNQIRKYINKLSGPLLDRFALQIWLKPSVEEEEPSYRVVRLFKNRLEKKGIRHLSKKIKEAQKITFYQKKEIPSLPSSEGGALLELKLSRRGETLLKKVRDTFLFIYPDLAEENLSLDDFFPLRDLTSVLQEVQM